MSVSGIFLLLLVYTLGNAWALFLPKPATFETRTPWLVPVVRLINPGPFGLKEVNISLLNSLRAYPLMKLFT